MIVWLEDGRQEIETLHGYEERYGKFPQGYRDVLNTMPSTVIPTETSTTIRGLQMGCYGFVNREGPTVPEDGIEHCEEES